MLVNILYFASLREALGTARETCDLPDGVDTPARLRTWLRERGGAWSVALAEGRNVRAAVDQTMASPDLAFAAGLRDRVLSAGHWRLTMAVVVKVQTEDFDAGAELARLRVGPGVGGIASFIGLVRDSNLVGTEQARVGALTLEHYPGMTERSLEAICDEACDRWSLSDVVVVHRHGRLVPTDQIVFVAVGAAHRGEAFEACAFVMDYLKTRAPFWKKETTDTGERWVEARESDEAAADRWAPAVTAR